jgi:hypothetical protein
MWITSAPLRVRLEILVARVVEPAHELTPRDPHVRVDVERDRVRILRELNGELAAEVIARGRSLQVADHDRPGGQHRPVGRDHRPEQPQQHVERARDPVLVAHRLRLAREHLEPGRQLDPLVERIAHVLGHVRQVDARVVLLAHGVNRGTDRGARARLGGVEALVGEILKHLLVRAVIARDGRRSDVKIATAPHAEDDLS